MRPLSVGRVTTPFIQRCLEHNANKRRLSRKFMYAVALAVTGDTCFISRFGPFSAQLWTHPAIAWAKQLEIEASVTGMLPELLEAAKAQGLILACAGRPAGSRR